MLWSLATNVFLGDCILLFHWFVLCKERGSPRLSLQQVQLSLLSCLFICEPHIRKAVPFAFLWPPHLCRCLVMSVKICSADGEELKSVALWLKAYRLKNTTRALFFEV